jgi:hypothetical protein
LSQQTQSFDIHDDDDVHDTHENNNNNAIEKQKWPMGVSTPKTSFCYTHSKLCFFKAIKVFINFVTLACWIHKRKLLECQLQTHDIMVKPNLDCYYDYLDYYDPILNTWIFQTSELHSIVKRVTPNDSSIMSYNFFHHIHECGN